ncbi:hypothetical protein BM1_01402 [Bipolaris maydis]|nr:hypothetical protein BM1_01402 [Bipolaris maydis]
MSPPPNGKTKHHCPGRDGWVGDISPGNCVQSADGTHCKTHEIPCTQGCGKYHLASQEACRKCVGKKRADERRERAERQKAKEEESKKKGDGFFNPGKERKKPRKKDPDPEPDAGAA